MTAGGIGRRAPVDGGDVPVVDLLDRLLETGACISGDVLLSVAGIDLVWVGLRSIVASVETARPRDYAEAAIAKTSVSALSSSPAGHLGTAVRVDELPRDDTATSGAVEHSTRPRAAHASPRPSPVSEPADRVELSEEGVERGLAQLVLTIVDLLRQLMERQAITRMEAGGLDDGQVDRLGTAFARLAERMDDLKATFGLTDEDLELRLGPIRDLL